MLTLLIQPISAAFQPFATPPPPTPSPLHTYPLQPIHRTSRSHLCRRPHPHHSALLLPILPHNAPTPFTSSSISTTSHHTDATTNTATFTSAPPALASPIGNTTGVPSSNNSRTTYQSQQNYLYDIGIPTTICITSPQSNSPPMTTTIKPGSRNIITFPTGCHLSNGRSFPNTSS